MRYRPFPAKVVVAIAGIILAETLAAPATHAQTPHPGNLSGGIIVSGSKSNIFATAKPPAQLKTNSEIAGILHVPQVVTKATLSPAMPVVGDAYLSMNSVYIYDTRSNVAKMIITPNGPDAPTFQIYFFAEASSYVIDCLTDLDPEGVNLNYDALVGNVTLTSGTIEPNQGHYIVALTVPNASGNQVVTAGFLPVTSKLSAGFDLYSCLIYAAQRP